jgi:protein-tyrosine phosphatase
VKLFLDYHPTPDKTQGDVPDPYYGDRQGFEDVLDLIETANRALLHKLKR